MALTGIDVTGRGLVVFDFDGTLANTTDGIIRVARKVLHDHGLTDEDLGDVRRIVGPPFPQAFSMVYGFSEEEATQIAAEYRAIYDNVGPAAWPLYDGVEGLLADLRAAGKSLGVASSKRDVLIRRALADDGITDAFDAARGKPDDLSSTTKAKTVAAVLADLGRTPEEAVMVGDRLYDVEAAAACGMPCVGVMWGNTCERAELEDAGACAIAETPYELLRILVG